MARTRSPNYPTVPLSAAIDSARKFYAKAQQTTVHPEDAQKAMGYQSVSGASRSRIAALRQYGLLDDAKGGVRLTELGLRLIHPTSDDEYQRAMAEAALMPPLFKELYESHRSADLSVIVPYLIRTRRFSQAGAKQAAEAFKDTVSVVKASPEGYASPDDKPPTDWVKNTLDKIMPRTPAPPPGSAPTVRWQNTVTLGDGLIAELRVISGRPVRVGDLRRIRRLLDTNLDTGIEAMEESDATAASDPSLATDPEDALRRVTPGS
jgi:hypothetical protein